MKFTDRYKHHKHSPKQPNKSYLYHLPDVDILPEPPEQQAGSVYIGEDIARFVTTQGAPCKLVSQTVAASVVSYNLDLTDIANYTKLPKICKMLSMKLRMDVTQGTATESDFTLIIPRKERRTVHFRNTILNDRNFVALDRHKLPVSLGMDTNNEQVAFALADCPHMGLFGSTGSGKSIMLNSILCSLLMRNTPNQVRISAIDPKRLELRFYEGIPHMNGSIITDTREAIDKLRDMCQLMEARLRLIEQKGLKDCPPTFHRELIVIEELFDLMLTSKGEAEEYLCRLLQMGRSAGIHLIIATQTPHNDVLTKRIRNNLPARCCLKVATAIDSRIALGMAAANGQSADKLLDKGDGYLIHPSKPGEKIRLQGSWIDIPTITAICNYWRSPDCIDREVN